jgi:YegS/Rv2252/BmrU family lipid kinase
MARRRLLLVANPRAGARAGVETARSVVPALSAAGFEVAIRTTEGPGHAAKIAGEAPDFEAVCAVGGDGTVHEVANGLAERDPADRPALAVVPAGSGNSLCADLGLADPLAAARRIAEGHRRPIDLARASIDGRTVWSINVLGWGAVSRINGCAERMRWAVGARYTLATLLELARPRIGDAEASVDGEPPGEWLFGMACVTQNTGKGMRIAPRAELADGRVDLVRVRRGPRLALARLLSGVYDGSHVDSPLVDYRQVESLQLDLAPGGRLLVDGELVAASAVSVEVVPHALELLA